MSDMTHHTSLVNTRAGRRSWSIHIRPLLLCNTYVRLDLFVRHIRKTNAWHDSVGRPIRMCVYLCVCVCVCVRVCAIKLCLPQVWWSQFCHSYVFQKESWHTYYFMHTNMSFFLTKQICQQHTWLHTSRSVVVNSLRCVHDSSVKYMSDTYCADIFVNHVSCKPVLTHIWGGYDW